MKSIEVLNPTHDRNSFDCGSAALNKFLQQTARQHIEKGISRTFVLIDTEQPQTIIGFFSLSLCEIQALKLPPNGFVSLQDNPLEMFLPLTTLRTILTSS